jgi:hypothetical protein
MPDAFAFQIDWPILASVIGLLVSLIGVRFYGRRDRN